jgi:hypothetical protein
MVTFKKTNTHANRGALAEKAVAKFLADWAGPTREANRLVDSKAAGRIIKAAAADFEFFCPEGHGLIEVKQTEHEFRLSRDKVPQLPRLRKRANCGGASLVIVYHSTLGFWRVVDSGWLSENGDKGSWNLSLTQSFLAPSAALNWICPQVFP